MHVFIFCGRLPQWSPPPRGWLKWNVDSWMRSKFGLAGVGGVLRNTEGQILCLFSSASSKMESRESELKAVRKAMEIITQEIRKTKVNIIIETSSVTVIRWLNFSLEQPWRYSEDFNRILALKKNFKDVSFRYIQRELNGMADQLSKQATSRSTDFVVWFHSI